MSHCLMQECKRRVSGKSYYPTDYSRCLANNEDEFLFDIEFKKNSSYTFYQKPNGHPIKKKINEIIMNLIFLMSQNIKDRFQMCNFFLSSYDKSSLKETAFKDKDGSINFYLKFISDIFT